MAKADTLFEGRSNCHSGKYLLFHAKQNVSSPFQSTQLLSLAQKKVPFVGKFKKVLQVSHLEKVYFSSLFMLGQNTTSRVFSYRYVIVRLFFVFGSCTNRDNTLWIPENDTVLSISIFEAVRQLSG